MAAPQPAPFPAIMRQMYPMYDYMRSLRYIVNFYNGS